MKEDNCMVKHLLILSTVLLVAGPIAGASDRQNDNDHMQKAGHVLDGQIQVPSSARLLIHELRAYPGATLGM
jgi:hypothetical protein